MHHQKDYFNISPLFSVRDRIKEKNTGDHHVDMLTSVEADKKILFPHLYANGFDCYWSQGKKMYEKIPPNDPLHFLTQSQRLILSGCGKVLFIYECDKIERILPVVAFTLEITGNDFNTRLSNKPRINLAQNVVRTLQQMSDYNDKLVYVYNILQGFSLYFLIVTSTGLFWFDCFNNIPLDQLYLTYRETPEKLDRIATKSSFQSKGRFHDIYKDDRLKKEISQALHNKSKYDSK